MKKHHFVAISGSLRKGSLNTLALQAAQQLVPAHVTIEQLFIEDVPMYNFDLYDKNLPEIVENHQSRRRAHFCNARVQLFYSRRTQKHH